MATSSEAAFGILLRRLRAAAGLSQEELADRAGVGVRTISDLERGVARWPHPSTLALLTQALGLDGDDEARAELEVAARRPARATERAIPDAASEPSRGLPGYLTHLVGRERDEAAVAHLLRSTDVRLVTLTGPGGVGKTRLAIQVAAGLADLCPDGARFVPLAALDDPRQVLPAVAHAVGTRPEAVVPVEEALALALGGKRLLLVLDNFEQVADAGPDLVALLVRCPGLRVLVTSRAALCVGGEHIYPVPPLPLPTPGRAETPGEALESPAVALFVARARAVRPDFALDYSNIAAVIEICRRLDGLPLALELAAARIAVLPPPALLARLESRLTLLSGGARDAPERHQTLRTAIAWSYDLLGDPERRLFRRLAVFAGGCTLEAAEALAPADDGTTVESLSSLVAQSLIERSDTPQGGSRFTMLATIREFALEQLVADGEEAAMRDAHAAYFLTVVENAGMSFAGAWSGTWLPTLQAEHDNLRTALAWSTTPAKTSRATKDYAPREQHSVTEQKLEMSELALRLSGALVWYWYARDEVSEGRAWMERALAHVPEAPPTVARARTLFGIGVLAIVQADYPAAPAPLQESVTILRPSGEEHLLVQALVALGLARTAQGDLASAVALYQESLALAQRLGDRWWEAYTLTVWGDARALTGDFAEAERLYQDGLSRFDVLGDRWGRGIPLNALGGLASTQGDYSAACCYFEESAAGFRAIGDKRGLVQSLIGLGVALLRAGNIHVAWQVFAEGLTLLHNLGNRTGILACIAGLAAVAAARGQMERAAILFAVAPIGTRAVAALLAPDDPSERERAIAAARAQLGDAAFEAARSAGQALTLEQAIAYALEP